MLVWIDDLRQNVRREVAVSNYGQSHTTPIKADIEVSFKVRGKVDDDWLESFIKKLKQLQEL